MPSFFGLLIVFSFCLSVYAQGCVLCTGVWVEASACVWQRGCLSSRRSTTPTRRRSWRGQVALAATQLHLNSSFPLRLLRLPNSMLCVVVCVERSACVLVRRRRWRSCRISGCFSGLCGYFYGAAGSTSEQNIHFKYYFTPSVPIQSSFSNPEASCSV